MPKTTDSQRLGKRNRKEKREHFENAGVIHGYKAKRLMQSVKTTVKEWKGTIGSSKGRTVLQLLLTKGPMYSYDVSDWGKKISSVLGISQKDAEEMVNEARKLKEGKVLLMESENKAILEKIQERITSGTYTVIPSHALEIR
ncbi:MAG: hypothetical protein PHW01_02405 [Patescibacteria group bacterium]|nr:hypothetical protein [Patescibacteria group bacterium]